MDTVIIRALRPHEKKRLLRMKRQRANAVNSLHARVLLLSRQLPLCLGTSGW